MTFFFSFFTKWKYRVATTNKFYFRFPSHCFSKELVLFALTLLFQWFTDSLLTIKYERTDWCIQIYTFHYLFNDCSDFRPSLRLFFILAENLFTPICVAYGFYYKLFSSLDANLCAVINAIFDFPTYPYKLRFFNASISIFHSLKWKNTPQKFKHIYFYAICFKIKLVIWYVSIYQWWYLCQLQSVKRCFRIKIA